MDGIWGNSIFVSCMGTIGVSLTTILAFIIGRKL